MENDITTDEIGEDERLTAAEKEVIVRFSKDGDRAHVFSEVGSVNRRLVEHSEFQLDRTRQRGGKVVAIWGELPIGSVSIGYPRKSDMPKDVVSRSD